MNRTGYWYGQRHYQMRIKIKLDPTDRLVQVFRSPRVPGNTYTSVDKHNVLP
jgi:hypothetical protein